MQESTDTFWLGRYFDNELYRQGMEWMHRHEAVTKCRGGQVPDGLLSADDLARLIRLNLLRKSDDGYRLAIAMFTGAQFKELDQLLSQLAADLAGILDRLVLRVWDELHGFVPKHLHDQINQFVAGYVHNIIGFTVFEMMDRGVLAPPPKEGPLAYGVFHVDRMPDWQV